MDEKYGPTLFALALIFLTYVIDWSSYQFDLKIQIFDLKIQIFDYLSKKQYILVIIFLVMSGIIQKKYPEVPNRSEILPIFDNVSQTFFYIMQSNLPISKKKKKVVTMKD